ncbi:hypothetical protein [Agrococcus sp. SGAir0287]|uniref:hypothetical protein n=1 Tax=Agrococcus sp. SGAir0287 TaxID=2070347 RepID=UPI001585D4E4|nr:hypothetical protein [Agrococcus sp. SGAir0287]
MPSLLRSWRPLLRTRGSVTRLRWLSRRSLTQRWYPQGIDVGTWQGRRCLAVSWFRQDRARRHLASRIAFVDLERGTSIDVALAIPADDGALEPAPVHAGGLAWMGDRLLVAATGKGLWEFDLGDVRTVRGAAARRLTGSRLPALGARVRAVVRTRVHEVPLRCSFVGRAYDADGAALPSVLVGEYRTDETGRMAEIAVPAAGEALPAPYVPTTPGIVSMQGAVRWGGTVLVSQSRGMRPGRLWRGPRDRLEPSGIALPVGCEDLAIDAESGTLWTVAEHPWRREVRGIALADLQVPHGRP